MQQVKIKSMQVSWIKDWHTSTKFFETLVEDGSLDLFKNPTMIELIRYMWSIARIYFIWYRFVPFVLFLYVPITTFTFIPIDVEDETWNRV